MVKGLPIVYMSLYLLCLDIVFHLNDINSSLASTRKMRLSITLCLSLKSVKITPAFTHIAF